MFGEHVTDYILATSGAICANLTGNLDSIKHWVKPQLSYVPSPGVCQKLFDGDSTDSVVCNGIVYQVIEVLYGMVA